MVFQRSYGYHYHMKINIIFHFFISHKFRKSSSREEKKNNEKQKRILNGIILKYHKHSMHRFYLSNKKKIQEMKKNDEQLSGNKAIELLWNQLTEEEKENWYQTSLENDNDNNSNNRVDQNEEEIVEGSNEN